MRKIKNFLLYNQNIKFLKVIFTHILDLIYPVIIKIWPVPTIHTIEETILKIKNERKSIARFGDGEVIFIVNKLDLKYQEYGHRLAAYLKTILANKSDDILVGLPDGYRDVTQFTPDIQKYTRSQVSFHWLRLRKLLNLTSEYYNANITRLYFGYQDQSNCGRYFELMRSLWTNKKILLIEGEKSRLGVGNDLFDNAISVERILGPKHHAFRQFDLLLEEALKHSKDKLVLAAMGPTAKVLAYELTKKGYQVIDVGNLDLEYTWYKANAKERFKVEGKYTSEVAGGRDVKDVHDPEYYTQIIAKFL
jgi:glycosyltransferase family protein